MRCSRFVVPIGAALTTACLLLKDLDALEGGDAGFSSDATQPTPHDAADDARAEGDARLVDANEPVDGGADAVADATTDAGVPCPSGRGPTMTRLRAPLGYCIDTTEVTNAHYRAFLEDINGDTSNQEPRCSGNTSFAVTGFPTAGNDDDGAVKFVPFCDALAFCKWAGKRLCAADANGTGKSEWFLACSANDNGLHPYPYGTQFQRDACNGLEHWQAMDASQHVTDVGSFDACVGGYPELFDMSGNVREWEDSCTETDAGTQCMVRGGAFYNGSGSLQCAAQTPAPPTSADIGNGIRCCAD